MTEAASENCAPNCAPTNCARAAPRTASKKARVSASVAADQRITLPFAFARSSKTLRDASALLCSSLSFSHSAIIASTISMSQPDDSGSRQYSSMSDADGIAPGVVDAFVISANMRSASDCASSIASFAFFVNLANMSPSCGGRGRRECGASRGKASISARRGGGRAPPAEEAAREHGARGEEEVGHHRRAEAGGRELQLGGEDG